MKCYTSIIHNALNLLARQHERWYGASPVALVGVEITSFSCCELHLLLQISAFVYHPSRAVPIQLRGRVACKLPLMEATLPSRIYSRVFSSIAKSLRVN